MRINVYSQELTPEVIEIEKESNTGRVYKAAQLILHSSPMLHHPPEDDDRSAVTFWLPGSDHRREEIARAFERVAAIFRGANQPAQAAQPVGVPDGQEPFGFVSLGGFDAIRACRNDEFNGTIDLWMRAHHETDIPLYAAPQPPAQPVGVPVGWAKEYGRETLVSWSKEAPEHGKGWWPLYTQPPAQPSADALDRAVEAFDDVYDGVSHNKREAIFAAIDAAREAKG